MIFIAISLKYNWKRHYKNIVTIKNNIMFYKIISQQ